MNRQHVHLSAEAETAKKVGQRKGKAVILKIEAAKMHKKGHTFFVSENNVWLTDHVPPAYIKQG
jgi:putative RNA 2'-phosphotransferase